MQKMGPDVVLNSQRVGLIIMIIIIIIIITGYRNEWKQQLNTWSYVSVLVCVCDCDP